MRLHSCRARVRERCVRVISRSSMVLRRSPERLCMSTAAGLETADRSVGNLHRGPTVHTLALCHLLLRPPAATLQPNHFTSPHLNPLLFRRHWCEMMVSCVRFSQPWAEPPPPPQGLYDSQATEGPAVLNEQLHPRTQVTQGDLQFHVRRPSQRPTLLPPTQVEVRSRCWV